jgi:hypothetical protein
MRAFPLQIDFFFDSGFPEDMVAAALAFGKTQALQQLPQIVKGNICIGDPSQDLEKQFVIFSHV